MVELECKNIISKNLRTKLVFSNEPVSFVGGVSIQDGVISDHRHPNYKELITDKAFAFPFGKGSSGAGLVLMEMMKIKTAPSVIINVRTDPVILTGPLIIKHFYNKKLCVINVSQKDYLKLQNAKEIEIFEDKNTIRLYD